METITHQYTLSETGKLRLEVKMAQLNKRAVKLGIAPMRLMVVAEEDRKVKHCDCDTSMVKAAYHGEHCYHLARFYTVDVIGQIPKLAGWMFRAVLQYVREAGQQEVIVHHVPGWDGDIPAVYLQRGADCDHCHTARIRNDTFLLFNGACWIQVGRQCLADYLGHGDVQSMVAYAELLCGLHATVEEDEGGERYGSGERRYELGTFLDICDRFIAVDGYISRSKADDLMRVSTAQCAVNVLARSPDFVKAYEAMQHDGKSYTDVEDAITWAQTADASDRATDYEHNIAVLARVGVVEYRTAGYAASILPAYMRWEGLRLEREHKAPSQHQGTVGKRQVFTGLTVTAHIPLESQWGVTHLYKMQDADGNIFTWFASRQDLAQGETVNLKATVKKHDTYNGQAQTILTRCVAVE